MLQDALTKKLNRQGKQIVSQKNQSSVPVPTVKWPEFINGPQNWQIGENFKGF
jgi:hypothetical protein